DGLRLEMIATRDPKRADRARRENPSARIISDPAAMLREPSIDLIVIATPNQTHVPLGIAALQAGKHAVVDKPIARTVAEAKPLLEAAESSGRILTVYQNRRWDGDFLTVQGVVAGGELGPIDSFESRFEWYQPEIKGWRDDPAESGGPLHDLGAHLIDQAILLFGPVHEVYAELDARRQGTLVPDSAFVSLTHDSGTRTRIWSSLSSVELGPRFLVRGLTGEYVRYGRDVQEEQLLAGLAPGDEGWGLNDQAGTIRLPGEPRSGRNVPTLPGSYERFYEGLRDAIQAGGPPPVDPLDSVAVLTVIERAMESASGARRIAAT
ncbi:MAG TPA: Gfo/Idh/MocA family oxidoreductase, partial [Candidatus Limnocylindrales bacterium]|nr:Gfo/Idh/MocA family oxidoreductase [Candidatus Limnocylindrales bacterium]